jgi:hypothetical protein
MDDDEGGVEDDILTPMVPPPSLIASATFTFLSRLAREAGEYLDTLAFLTACQARKRLEDRDFHTYAAMAIEQLTADQAKD